MKKSRKIGMLILALLLTVNYSVFAEIPDNTVVIGDKAYDLRYVNEKENYSEIIEQFKKNQPIYIKIANGTWYDNKTLSTISNQFIPRVTYKDAEGNLTEYAKMDGEKIILKVLRCNFISKNQIQIKFNNKLNKATALSKSNYTINGKILDKNDTIHLSEDLQTIIITFNENIKDKAEISIFISKKIKDLNNNLINSKFTEDIILFNKENYIYNSMKKIDKNINVVANKETISNVEINGDCYICGDNVTINDSIVKGTIYIDPGKDGSTNIKNVKAKNIEVLSGGTNSIHLYNVNADNLNISSESNVRVEAKGNTKIGNTIVHTYAILDSISGTLGEVRIIIDENKKNDKNQCVELRGIFKDTIIIETSILLKAAKNANISKVKILPQNIHAEINLVGNFKEVELNKEAIINLVKSIINKLVANTNTHLNISKYSKIKQINKKGHDIKIEGSGKANVDTDKKNDSDREYSHNSNREHSHNNNNIVEVDKVKLDKTKASLNIGEKIKLNASVIPSNADNKSLRWSTENKDIVSIEDGEITALKEGKEIVRVTSNNGKYAECEVNVVRIKTQVNVEGEKATIILDGDLVKDKVITIKIINIANNSIEDVEQINRTDNKCEYLSKLDSGNYYALINISGVGKIETNKFTIGE